MCIRAITVIVRIQQGTYVILIQSITGCGGTEEVVEIPTRAGNPAKQDSSLLCVVAFVKQI